MKKKRSTFRHAAIYSAATIFGKLVGFVMLPFYAHIFSTEGYGVIGMIDTSLGMLMIPLAGGLQSATMRYYHEQPANRKSVVLGTGIRIVWGIGFALVVLPLIFSTSVSQLLFGSGEYDLILRLALLSFVVDVAGNNASTLLIIQERSVLFSAISLARLCLGLSLNIWLIIILKVGLVGVFISSLITAIVGSGVLHFIAIREHGICFDRDIARGLLRFQLPMLPGDIFAFCGRQAERVLVRIYVSLEGMGILEMAYRFPPLLNLFISVPFQRAWRTKSIEIAEEKWAPATMGSMLTFYVFLMVFAGLVMAVSIPQILMLLTPPEFWPAARLARVEILTTILGGCTTFMNFGILYQKKTHLISLIRMTLVPLKIALAYGLIVALGINGAAYSALIIQAITLVWMSYWSQALYPIVVEWGKVMLVVCSALALYVLLADNKYSEFVPAIYARTELIPELLRFLSATPLGNWKDGKVINILQMNAEPFTILIFNILFSALFIVILPLVWQRKNTDIISKMRTHS